jgi:hypothetical protein
LAVFLLAFRPLAALPDLLAAVFLAAFAADVLTAFFGRVLLLAFAARLGTARLEAARFLRGA